MIKVEHLFKFFSLSSAQQKELGIKTKELSALTDLSFSCSAGKILMVLGSKNSGKSTLLGILATILKPDKGNVQLMGLDLNTHAAEIRKHVGFFSANQPFFEYLTVAEQLEYSAGLKGMTGGMISDRLPVILEKWHLAAIKNKRISSISAAEKLLLGIAQSVVHNPRLLLLDEPALGLDLFSAKPVFELVDYAKKDGMTVVYATNNLSKTELIGDELIVLHQGRLIHHSSIVDFRNLSEDSLSAAFLSLLHKAQI